MASLRRVSGTWKLVSWSGVSLDGLPTIRLSHLRTPGESGAYEYVWWGICNSHSGFYLVRGDDITFTPGASTLVGCGETREHHDSGFYSFLSVVETWSIDGSALVISGPGDTLARFARVEEREPAGNPGEGIGTVAPRLHFVDEIGFMVRLQLQERAEGMHASQDVNWVSWSNGLEETADGFAWEAGRYATKDAETVDQYGPESWSIPLERALTRIVPRQGYESLCLLGSTNTIHGADPSVLRRVPYSSVHLFIEEEASASPRAEHTDEIIGLLMADCGIPANQGQVAIGRVAGVTDDWGIVRLERSFDDPVIVAGPASMYGRDPGVVEVRNLTGDSFEIRFREWDYLDGWHPTGETMSYLVVERGVTVLPSGARIEAGTVSATTASAEVRFDGAFPGIPIVLATPLR